MSVFFRIENSVENAGQLSVPELPATESPAGLNSTRPARHDGRVPASVVAWLQGLLRERFHDSLTLQAPQDGHWILSAPGIPRQIRVRNEFAVFHTDPLSLPCSHWLPQEDSAWLPDGCVGLPAPGAEQVPHWLITHDEHGLNLHYDVFSLAYWMLSRHEEVERQDLDPHGRFPAEASHAFRHGYLERPIVDEWFEVLHKVMHTVWPSLPVREHHYATVLSHDVDTPARYGLISAWRLARNMTVDLLRERMRDRQALLRAPWIWKASSQQLHERDPFNTFDWVMQCSEDAGLRNAFYFICGRTDPQRDGHYEPGHPAIVALMRRIHERGHEIGLHPSYNTYLNPPALLAEADRLREICLQAGIHQAELGVRMHYLRWQTPETPRSLEAAGLAYDSTLGYAKHPGFRSGTCHEYQAFDPVMGRALNLRLRPLIVMESTIIQGMRPKQTAAAEARMLRLMDACHRVKGNFTVLWHNTMLEHPHQRRVYESLLNRHKELA